MSNELEWSDARRTDEKRTKVGTLFLAYPAGNSACLTGARECHLTPEAARRLVHDIKVSF